MVAAGLTSTYFENPYIRKILQDLEPRHRPVYQKKLLRLVRCIINESGEEVWWFFQFCSWGFISWQSHHFSQLSWITRERYLVYELSFIASQSDFWWCPLCKCSFAACVFAMITKRYNTSFGLLAISDITVRMMERTGKFFGLLKNVTSELQRLEGIGDFWYFNLPKTGKNIGAWLHKTHVNLSAKPSFIGSHVVDRA